MAPCADRRVPPAFHPLGPHSVSPDDQPTTMNTRIRRSLAACAGLPLLFAATSCVSQQRFDEMSESARLYQSSFNDVSSANEQLRVENDDLRRQLEDVSVGVGTMEAAAEPIDPAIDERMARLDELAQRLGNAPGDVRTVDVDGGYGFVLSDGIVFESGAAEPTPAGRAVLLELAADIASKPFDALWVRGHTDNVPMRREASLSRYPYGNIHLSAVRALAVRDILVNEGGLPASKLFVAGFGPHLPVAANDSPEGRRSNRRVEVYVIDSAVGELP